ncbi:MAG: rhomboid family intramembrane serine protease [Candidatus Paceibacterota bacterium]
MILSIILATAIVSYLAFSNPSLFHKLTFSPYRIKHNKEYIRWIGHGFIHADYMHLIVNMMTLYFFSSALEQISMIIAGQFWFLYFVLFYLLAIVMSSLYSYHKNKDNYSYSAVGASGATSAMVFSYILFAPTSKIYLYFAIGIPSWLFGVLYLVYSYYMGKKQQDNIGHDAHLFGALFGVVFTIISYPDVVLSFLSAFL